MTNNDFVSKLLIMQFIFGILIFRSFITNVYVRRKNIFFFRITLMIYENKQTKQYVYVIHYIVNTDARRLTGFVDNKVIFKLVWFIFTIINNIKRILFHLFKFCHQVIVVVVRITYILISYIFDSLTRLPYSPNR